MKTHSGHFAPAALTILLALSATLPLLPVPARCAPPLVPTSIRAAGMGGASNAVFWGDDPDDWANPALSAYHSGIRYTFGRTQLLPQFSDDIFVTSHRFNVAGGGVGVETSGRPLDGLGGQHIDYGKSELTDQSGNLLGEFKSYEDEDSWRLGVSLAGVMKALDQWRGTGFPHVLRTVDVGAGYGRRHLEERYIPTVGAGKADMTDYGVLLRVTPFDSFDSDGAGRPARLDVAMAWSVLNSGDAIENFPFFGSTAVPRMDRFGTAAHFALGGAPNHVPASPAWYSGAFEPLVSVGVAADFEHVEHDRSSSYDVRHYGLESVVMNVLWLRVGQVEDQTGDIHGTSGGFGVGYQFGNVGSLRYDFASIPQGGDLKNINRHGFTIALHPLALARSGR